MHLKYILHRMQADDQLLFSPALILRIFKYKANSFSSCERTSLPEAATA